MVVVLVVVVVAAGPKLAVTAAFDASKTTQVLAAAAALHAPLQPAKDEPPLGVAVRVTAVPISQSAEQTVPHAIPSGVLATVPNPAPASVTESVAVLRGVDATRAGHVLDDDALAEFLAELVGHDARGDVGDAAGAERQDDLDRLFRPGRFCSVQRPQHQGRNREHRAATRRAEYPLVHMRLLHSLCSYDPKP